MSNGIEVKGWRSWLQLGNVLMLCVTAWLLVDGMPNILRWRAVRDAPPYRRPEAFDWVDPSKGVGIISFYAYPGAIYEGDTTSVCYAVMNAKAVKIEPPSAEVWPTFNRCIEVSPGRNTTYTLTAADAHGKTVTKSFELIVLPEPTRAPRIHYFRVRESKVDRGDTVHLLCFSTANAELVQVDPPAFPSSEVLQGCFYAVPKQPVTYTLTATGTFGRKAVRKLTVAPDGPVAK
ncbi:hypothetical protein [uncultured Paludibaculum sp.]|uniref:hypothetical protein n=1 Tax=uncultured Paludibaculum sp. TaxID=1765020 RepID=UPI002AAA95DA|nr:hypothetical protein [uncultured Paludibaculum sp.]